MSIISYIDTSEIPHISEKRNEPDVPTFVQRSMTEKDAHLEEDESIHYLMGRLLRHTHTMCNLEKEEYFLAEVEREVDMFVEQVMEAKGEVPYTQQKSEQLILFEKMEEYLANKSCLGADIIK